MLLPSLACLPSVISSEDLYTWALSCSHNIEGRNICRTTVVRQYACGCSDATCVCAVDWFITTPLLLLDLLLLAGVANADVIW